MTYIQTITDHDLQALVDNELSWEEQKYLLSMIDYDLQAQKRYKELVDQKKILKSWYQSINA